MTSITTLHKHQLLNHLLGLVREQAKALQADDLDRFLALMDEREEIIAELGAADADPAPANVIPFPAIAPSNVSSDVEMTMRYLLRAILEEDDENVRLLQAQMNDLHVAIARTVRSRAAGGGYATMLAGSGPRPVMDRVC
jgi:hypothetical protein